MDDSPRGSPRPLFGDQPEANQGDVADDIHELSISQAPQDSSATAPKDEPQEDQRDAMETDYAQRDEVKQEQSARDPSSEHKQRRDSDAPHTEMREDADDDPEALANRKPEPKRPGKESGRFWKCYWDGCENVYTRRRTVTDHMVKAHKIKKEEFDTEKCKEIIYLDEAKTEWKYLDQPRSKRPPKKGMARPAQSSPKPSGPLSSMARYSAVERLSTASPGPEAMPKRKTSTTATPTKPANTSRAVSPDNKERQATTSPQQTDDEYGSGEDDYGISDDELYCLCRKPDDGTPMVCCDGCDEWYHIRCVGLHKEEVNNLLVKYFCPRCQDQGKGECVFRLECSVQWCKKAATPESKFQFCSPQHREDWILYHIKRSDPTFQIRSKDGQALYVAWFNRMKKRHGDKWEPQQVAKVREDKTGRLSMTEAEKPTLGGPLKLGELKSLIDSAQDVAEFKILGNKGYKPVRPNRNIDIKSQSYLTNDENGEVAPEQRFAELKELLDLRRQVLAEAKATHKFRIYCGYDNRLALEHTAFKKIMEAGDDFHKPCEAKNCRQHNDWVKNETKSVGLEAEVLRRQAKVLGIVSV